MTADEIRKEMVNGGQWDKLVNDREIALEIAAQLAELNETMAAMTTEMFLLLRGEKR